MVVFLDQLRKAGRVVFGLSLGWASLATLLRRRVGNLLSFPQRIFEKAIYKKKKKKKGGGGGGGGFGYCLKRFCSIRIMTSSGPCNVPNQIQK